MDSTETHPIVRGAALGVVLVALLPITMGAFVTTLGAGMAFLDWPSSDGQNMLLYPWLQDIRNPDKFTEHGHRLAGVLIGLCSIGLCVLTFVFDRRVWLRRFSVGILLAVICQGLLGGARVLLDRDTLAMLHSISGSMFFSLCLIFLLLTSSGWNRLRSERDNKLSVVSFGLVILLPLFVFGQYLLGSSFRHLHTMLDEHIVGAVVVSLLTIFVTALLKRSGSGTLRRCGNLLTACLLLQVVLGLASFVTSLGFKPYGIVAVRGSWSQTIVCSLHTVGGMFLLGSSVISAAVSLRLFSLGLLPNASFSTELPARPGSGGGVS